VTPSTPHSAPDTPTPTPTAPDATRAHTGPQETTVGEAVLVVLDVTDEASAYAAGRAVGEWLLAELNEDAHDAHDARRAAAADALDDGRL
jgi:hypothetical protein